MGNDVPEKPKQTLEDALIQIRISSKRMMREAQKAMKDSQTHLNKAKIALRKNNEDGAKLHIQSASSKRTQAIGLQRMSTKMQFIAANMKSMSNNEKIMASFQQMTQIANPNFENLSSSVENLQKCMDNILINGKMMEQLMSQENASDNTTENMMQVLKQQVAIEEANRINEVAQIQQKQMEFAENLKKL